MHNFPTLPTERLVQRACNPNFKPMWQYPKSPLHQAAIDAMKAERDLEASRCMAAQMKLRREREAVQDVKDRETDKLAVLAKTERLRAARLAREAEARPKSAPLGKLKRS